MVQAIPEGYTSVTAYLTFDNASEALAFYQKAFDATVLFQMPMADKIGHAEIQIGNAKIMLADQFDDMGNVSPKQLGGSPVSFVVYIEDVDSAYEQAVAAGCQAQEAITDKFWGDRMGSVVDPFGYQWSLATHIEDVSPEELQKRMEVALAE